MELKYNLTVDDYIAFNTEHFKRDKNISRRRMLARFIGPVLFVIMAIMIMFFEGQVDYIPAIVYGIFAVLWFVFYPVYEEKRFKKNLKKMLDSSENRFILGERTLLLQEDGFLSSGEKNENRCSYELVERLCTDDGHFYLYVGAANAVIIPFAAFNSETEKQEFVSFITEKVQKSGGNI